MLDSPPRKRPTSDPYKDFPLVCLLFMVASLVLAVVLLVVLLPRIPAAPVASTLPAIPETGAICTFVPEQFETVDEDCAEFDQVLCDNRHAIANQTCIRESCTPGINDGNVFQALAITNGGLGPDEEHFEGALLRPNGANVSMILMIQKLMLENVADSLDPDVDPPPQPLLESVVFLPEDYDTGNFTLAPREWLRQHFIAAWSFAAMVQYQGLHADNTTVHNLYNLVFVPERCETSLSDIPWVQHHNVTFVQILEFAGCLIALNKDSNASTEAGFPTYCATYCAIPTALCEIVGLHYTFSSLSNVTETPSLYADFNRLETLFNVEYKDCRKGVGCMGVPLSVL